MNKTLLILCSLVLISTMLGVLPTILHGVPPGHVDTAFHIAIGLDVQEGNIKSLAHQWWHLRNHEHYEDAHLVNRYQTRFVYPPLIHVLLAITYIFIPVGIGTAGLIAALYALSIPAIYSLLRSFDVSTPQALVGAAIMTVSTPLLYSQHAGFWTFAIALNFASLSYASIRYHKVAPSIFFGVCAVLTHWVFFAGVITVILVEWVHRKNDSAKTVLLVVSSICIPLLIGTIMLSSWPYIGTSHTLVHLDNIILIIAAMIGAWHVRNTIPEVVLYAAITSIIVLGHSVGLITIIFSDMLQYAVPYFVASFAALGIKHSRRALRPLMLFLVGIGIILATASSLTAVLQVEPSISDEELTSLLEVRQELILTTEDIIFWEIETYPGWIVVLSKDARIAYPFSLQEEPNLARFYTLYTAYNLTEPVQGNKIVIQSKNNTIIAST